MPIRPGNATFELGREGWVYLLPFSAPVLRTPKEMYWREMVGGLRAKFPCLGSCGGAEMGTYHVLLLGHWIALNHSFRDDVSTHVTNHQGFLFHIPYPISQSPSAIRHPPSPIPQFSILNRNLSDQTIPSSIPFLNSPQAPLSLESYHYHHTSEPELYQT